MAKLKMLTFSLGVSRMDQISKEYIIGTVQVDWFGDKVRGAKLKLFRYLQRRDSSYIGGGNEEDHNTDVS